MKVLVCGKGGSGKSTVTALLAKYMAKKGYNVLVIDSDESNFGLHRQLGVELPDDFMNFMGGKRALGEKMREAFLNGKEFRLFENSWGIADVPEAFVGRNEGVSLMAIGKIHDFGEGCACPMGALAKYFLKNIEVGERDFVIVDTEAGVEHFGRGVEEGCDLVLMVLDPSYESVRLSEKIKELSEKAGKEIYFVFNRADEMARNAMLDAVAADRVLTSIPPNETVFQAGLAGKEFDVALPEIEFLSDFLISARGN
ncbi:Nickel insertion protein [Methanosarcina sp. MTP4]|uniref:ATP-binding protein n=1 Tax=Methanosarcina sp. MTP4 TaxID=1434100 RepID=UPI00061610AA|nr:P-loop NTPase [Methanosarcina sp. MTP4]AKB23518.1 Nickel insertion protein [Methanosarcina sp. MTP4]